MTAGVDLRLLRAAVFAAVCVTLSAAGHLLAAGGGLPFVTLLAGFAAVLVVALPLAGRECSLRGITALLALGQSGLHLLFSCGSHPAPASGTSPDPGGTATLAQRLLCHTGSGQLSPAEAHRIVADAGLSPAHTTAHAAGPAAGTPLDCLRSAAHTAVQLLDGPMLLGHLLAALVLGWLLRRGEAALWRLVRLSAQAAAVADEVLAARALRAALAYVRALHAGLLPRVPARAVARRDRGDVPEPRSALLQHSVHRRGPPAPARDALTLAA
ncbi:hypothetical protein [Streptomyces cacaoi]|uniref:hypothetical protein n=1 Tax=Streptomyces cacaoi TaxID=1898 RepID=UPI0037493163